MNHRVYQGLCRVEFTFAWTGIALVSNGHLQRINVHYFCEILSYSLYVFVVVV